MRNKLEGPSFLLGIESIANKTIFTKCMVLEKGTTMSEGRAASCRRLKEQS